MPPRAVVLQKCLTDSQAERDNTHSAGRNGKMVSHVLGKYIDFFKRVSVRTSWQDLRRNIHVPGASARAPSSRMCPGLGSPSELPRDTVLLTETQFATSRRWQASNTSSIPVMKSLSSNASHRPAIPRRVRTSHGWPLLQSTSTARNTSNLTLGIGCLHSDDPARACKAAELAVVRRTEFRMLGLIRGMPICMNASAWISSCKTYADAIIWESLTLEVLGVCQGAIWLTPWHLPHIYLLPLYIFPSLVLSHVTSHKNYMHK